MLKVDCEDEDEIESSATNLKSNIFKKHSLKRSLKRMERMSTTEMLKYEHGIDYHASSQRLLSKHRGSLEFT